MIRVVESIERNDVQSYKKEDVGRGVYVNDIPCLQNYSYECGSCSCLFLCLCFFVLCSQFSARCAINTVLELDSFLEGQ